jgi:hypothetical protein
MRKCVTCKEFKYTSEFKRPMTEAQMDFQKVNTTDVDGYEFHDGTIMRAYVRRPRNRYVTGLRCSTCWAVVLATPKGKLKLARGTYVEVQAQMQTARNQLNSLIRIPIKSKDPNYLNNREQFIKWKRVYLQDAGDAARSLRRELKACPDGWEMLLSEEARQHLTLLHQGVGWRRGAPPVF